jgi:hypothetical protein
MEIVARDEGMPVLELNIRFAHRDLDLVLANADDAR